MDGNPTPRPDSGHEQEDAPENPVSASDILSAAVAAMPDGLGILRCLPEDDDFIWVHANPALLRLTGGEALCRRRLIGDRADGGAGPAIATLVIQARGAGGQSIERILLMQDGHRRVVAQGFAADGCPHVSLTVSEFAASRGTDPLRVGLEHCFDAVALFDADARLVEATGQMKALFPEVADLIEPGVPLEAMVRRYAEQQPAEAGGGNTAWVQQRLERHRAGNTHVTFRTISGRWLRNGEWKTPDGGVISIFTDVTDFKQVEQRLRTSEAEAQLAKAAAEKANRAKSEFLTHMSHELRTPLNAIIGFADLITMETFGPLGHPRYQIYAQDILDSGRHLLELVDDSLDIGKIDSGKLDLVEEMLALSTEAWTVADTFDEQLRDRSITLTRDMPADLPLLIADRRAFRLVMQHLLSNAIKFTPAEGSVLVSASETPDGGIGMMIADTGIGIAEADIERVQQPFGRTDLTIPHFVEGTGLGLPIVKRLVELHGGRMELMSEPGLGTTVILTFPCERVVRPSAVIAQE